MNCSDCAESLSAYVDRELSDEEVEEVKSHLEDCPPCEDRFLFQANLKRLVRLSCGSEKAPADLRAKLREILF